MGALLGALESVDFLAEAPRETVVSFMVLGRSVDERKGHVFWREGDAPTGLLIPVTGAVKCVTRNDEGREYIAGFAGPGQCLGLAPSLTGIRHPCAAEAMRSGEYFTMTPDQLDNFLHQYPSYRADMMRFMGQSLGANLKERSEMAVCALEQRLARLLLAHACMLQGAGARVLLPGRQRDLAARLGTVREVVSRRLSALAAKGSIEVNARGIFIRDWDALRADAGLAADEDASMCDATGDAEVRTKRFFLPLGERRRRRRRDPRCNADPEALPLCRAIGCPSVRTKAPVIPR